jgi:hypothetical protein
MSRPVVLILVLVLVLVLAAAGCHSSRQACQAHVSSLKGDAVALERKEKATLAAVDRKRGAYEVKIAAREKEVRTYYARCQHADVAAAAERYRGLLADKRATDVTTAPEMNRKIAAAAAEFREAVRRSDEAISPKERAALAALRAKQRALEAKFTRYREAVVARFRRARGEIDRKIALEQGYLAALR